MSDRVRLPAGGILMTGREFRPEGLCGTREEHAAHPHESESLGRFWCTADQSQREPGRSQRLQERAVVAPPEVGRLVVGVAAMGSAFLDVGPAIQAASVSMTEFGRQYARAVEAELKRLREGRAGR